MRGSDDFHHGANPHRFSDSDSPGAVKKTGLADPAMIADPHLIAVICFQYRIVADVHIIAKGNVFRVEDEHSGFKDHVRAQRSKIPGLKTTVAVTRILFIPPDIHIDILYTLGVQHILI